MDRPPGLHAGAIPPKHAEEKPFGPQDLLNGLIQNNPETQAARFRFEAATKRPSQAVTLPEPTASYTNLGVGHPFSRLNASEFSYQGLGVSQELPFPGKLGLLCATTNSCTVIVSLKSSRLRQDRLPEVKGHMRIPV